MILTVPINSLIESTNQQLHDKINSAQKLFSFIQNNVFFHVATTKNTIKQYKNIISNKKSQPLSGIDLSTLGRLQLSSLFVMNTPLIRHVATLSHCCQNHLGNFITHSKLYQITLGIISTTTTHFTILKRTGTLGIV